MVKIRKTSGTSSTTKSASLFEPVANRALLPWGPGDGYHFWWLPLDVVKLRENEYIAPDDFELAGLEEIQGRRCHVLQSRAGFIRLCVGADDGRLYRREILLSGEKDAARLAIYQKIGGPSIKTLSDWTTWLKGLKPHDFKLAVRQWHEAEFGSARVWLRQTFEDYREVAPGCWLSFRQETDMYETDAAQPFLSLHAEQIIVDMAINKPLPQELFHLDLAEGTEVATDLRYDPPISYTYRKNQTEAERVALCDAERTSKQRYAMRGSNARQPRARKREKTLRRNLGRDGPKPLIAREALGNLTTPSSLSGWGLETKQIPERSNIMTKRYGPWATAIDSGETRLTRSGNSG